MKIIKSIKQKLFPKYTKWEIYTIVNQVIENENNSLSVYRLIECRENVHSGKKFFKTTVQLESSKNKFTERDLINNLLNLQSIFRNEKASI
jgi:hypothetical protein